MIPAPTIVVVDDRKDHLDSIAVCLNRMGYSCLPVWYQNGKLYTGGDKEFVSPLNSIQLLFTDIEYLSGLSKTDTFGMVTTVLEQVLAVDNGPYTLITWSTFPDQHDELMSYLSTELSSAIPAPAASALLDKNEFLIGGADSGNFDHKALAQKIRAITEDKAEVNALVRWADDARTASGEVVLSIMRLLSRETLFAGGGGEQLVKLLSAIALEGGGKNASVDRTSAMNEGLGPILIDRLMHATHEHREQTEDAWQSAIPDPIAAGRLEAPEKAALNTMTSISNHDIEHVQVGSRGAVCSLSDEFASNEAFIQRFGLSSPDLVWEFLELKGPHRNNPASKTEVENAVVWKLVGYSAACDHAQKNVPQNLKKVFLMLEVHENLNSDLYRIRNKGAVLKLPPFNHEGRLKIFVFNWHYTISVTGEFDGSIVDCRLREPLVTWLINEYHKHGSRLGVPDY